MRKYMYLISILILSSCQVADVQNGTEKKDNFLQEVGRLSDFVLSQSKVGGYLSEEDAVILDNWLKELSTRYDFQNNFDYCGDIYTRSDYEPDFYDYLNWIEENNLLPINKEYNAFLLDSNNEVVYVGSPLLGRKMRSLFISIVKVLNNDYRNGVNSDLPSSDTIDNISS